MLFFNFLTYSWWKIGCCCHHFMVVSGNISWGAGALTLSFKFAPWWLWLFRGSKQFEGNLVIPHYQSCYPYLQATYTKAFAIKVRSFNVWLVVCFLHTEKKLSLHCLINYSYYRGSDSNIIDRVDYSKWQVLLSDGL